jgi:hypothetical protein
LVFLGASKEPSDQSTNEIAIETNIKQSHLGIEFWVGGISWLTDPLESNFHIIGNITIEVWISSSKSLESLAWSGYGGGLVEIDENDNPIWNNAPTYHYTQGSILSIDPSKYTITINNLDHVFQKGNRIGFVVGIGATMRGWEAKIHFGSEKVAQALITKKQDWSEKPIIGCSDEAIIIEGQIEANGRVVFHIPSISSNEFSLGFYDFDFQIRLMEQDVHILCVYQTKVIQGKIYDYRITLSSNNRIKCYVDQKLLIDYTYALDTFDTPPWSDDFSDLHYTLSHTRHWYVGFVRVKNGILTLLPKPFPYDNTIRCMRYSIHPNERNKWKDYAAETYFMIVDAPIEVPFRIFDDEHREILYLSEDLVSIYRYYGLEIAKLGESFFPITRGSWHHLRLEVEGQTFRVYVDNQHILTCKDLNPRLLTTGSFGVGVAPNSTAKFIAGLIVFPI